MLCIDGKRSACRGLHILPSALVTHPRHTCFGSHLHIGAVVIVPQSHVRWHAELGGWNNAHRHTCNQHHRYNQFHSFFHIPHLPFLFLFSVNSILWVWDMTNNVKSAVTFYILFTADFNWWPSYNHKTAILLFELYQLAYFPSIYKITIFVHYCYVKSFFYGVFWLI